MTLAAEPQPLDAEEPESTADPLQARYPHYAAEALPLSHYARIMGLYNLAFVTFLIVSRQSGKPIPERIGWNDILLLGVATFKLSRLISKEIVTTRSAPPSPSSWSTRDRGR